MFRSLFRPNPERLLKKRDVEGLIKAIRYKDDSTVRAKAAAALGAFGDPRSVEALIEALGDEVPGVCGSAALSLNKIGGSKAAAALAEYKSMHCMKCGKRVQGPEQRRLPAGMDIFAALERAGQMLATRCAECQCGAVLCLGCSPSGGGDLPGCKFCGAELTRLRLF